MTALDELEVGQELPPLVVQSVDPEKTKLMAAILQDPNPIHFDAESVRALGLGDGVINQGPSNLSYVLNMVMRWSGGRRSLRSVAMRFLGNVFAGDRVECRGRVAAVEEGSGAVTVEVQALVGERPVLEGTVVVSSPHGSA
jgi:acyl dehydratase